MKRDYKIWLFVAAVVILVTLLFLRRGKSAGSTDTAGELSILKDKIKNMETYKTREGYTSPNDNNGMTIAGTLLEQFLDISIEVFNQPLVKEMLDKIIKDTGDARVLADFIEDIGDAVKESIKQNDLLQCLTKLDCKEEIKRSGEGEGLETLETSTIKCRVGDTDEFVELGAVLGEEVIDEGQVDDKGVVRDRIGRNGETVGIFADGSRWHSSDKKNCHRYKIKAESFEKIGEGVQKKIGEMFMDPEKQKLYYDTFIQIGKNNTDFITAHHAYLNAESKRGGYINPFDEGGDFAKQMPRDHAYVEMTKFGKAIKEGRGYYARNAPGRGSKHLDVHVSEG